MPELPDITVYVESLTAKRSGQILRRVRILNPFVLRTAVPPIGQAEGAQVTGVERLGKRVVLVLQGADGVARMRVVHRMIAGRLRWLASGAKAPGRIGLAAFEFDHGQLLFAEAGTQRSAGPRCTWWPGATRWRRWTLAASTSWPATGRRLPSAWPPRSTRAR